MTEDLIHCCKCKSSLNVNENKLNPDLTKFPFKNIIDAISIEENPYFIKCPNCGVKAIIVGQKEMDIDTKDAFGL